MRHGPQRGPSGLSLRPHQRPVYCFICQETEAPTMNSKAYSCLREKSTAANSKAAAAGPKKAKFYRLV
jgi:hypothetical protein